MFSFEVPSYFVNESDGSVEVCLRLLNSTLERSVILSLITGNGTAIGIQKYSPQSFACMFVCCLL